MTTLQLVYIYGTAISLIVPVCFLIAKITLTISEKRLERKMNVTLKDWNL